MKHFIEWLIWICLSWVVLALITAFIMMDLSMMDITNWSPMGRGFSGGMILLVVSTAYFNFVLDFSIPYPPPILTWLEKKLTPKKAPSKKTLEETLAEMEALEEYIEKLKQQ